MAKNQNPNPLAALLTPEVLAAALLQVSQGGTKVAEKVEVAFNSEPGIQTEGASLSLYKSKRGSVTLRVVSKDAIITKPDGQKVQHETFIGYLYGPDGTLKPADQRTLTLKNKMAELAFEMKQVKAIADQWGIKL